MNLEAETMQSFKSLSLISSTNIFNNLKKYFRQKPLTANSEKKFFKFNFKKKNSDSI